MSDIALITGVCGQDGAYLAQYLLGKGYEVIGTSRDAAKADVHNLNALGIGSQVKLQSLDLLHAAEVTRLLTASQPDEIYHLAGQSSVGASFAQPAQTIASIELSTLNLLEAMRTSGSKAKLFVASSGECFGDTGGIAADENTPFKPQSPYAVAKAAAFWQVATYREAYGLYACSGLLFNHESPLRSERFVTQKIITAACRIAAGRQDMLELGDITVQRDWGWAEEYVQAMWAMLQQPCPDDFVLATDETYPLSDFVRLAFEAVGLDWKKYVKSSDAFKRNTDIPICRANPSKAERVLGWRAQTRMGEVVQRMIVARRIAAAA